MWSSARRLVLSSASSHHQRQWGKTAAASLAAAVTGGGVLASSLWFSRTEDHELTAIATLTTSSSSSSSNITTASSRSTADATITSSLSLWSSLSSSLAPRRALCEWVGLSLMSSFPSRRQRDFIMSNNKKKAVALHQEEKDITKALDEKYEINWDQPIGEGAFGKVYKGICKETKEIVAIKKIGLHNDSFQREIAALQHIQSHGDHPSICSMRDYFSFNDDNDATKEKYSYVVLDFVNGGEMFDHLCTHGPYSEADAARLIREVSSALSFLHGLNCVHGDLKPENLLLSSNKSSAAHLKLIDFGSSQIKHDDNKDEVDTDAPRLNATPAYSPPEFDNDRTIDPSFDMWAVGVILYIMLTGLHPFDLYGDKTDEEIEESIRSGHRPPTRRSPITAHLSNHAILLLERLLEWDPKNRMTAMELLDHPWVKGETARQKKMAGSDKRLAAHYRTYKTRFEAKVFAKMVNNFGIVNNNNPTTVTTNNHHHRFSSGGRPGWQTRRCLMERAFGMLDPSDRGYVTAKDLEVMAAGIKEAENNSTTTAALTRDEEEEENHQLSLSGFKDLLSENMKNKYFQKGDIIYNQGEVGNAMYFVNSGSVEVFCTDGTRNVLQAGDFFGEGALLHPKGTRSCSVRSLTPVHVLEISRQSFEKYLANDDDANINLREKHASRKRQRVKAILQSIQHMKERKIAKGKAIFKTGDEGKEMFVLEKGVVSLQLSNDPQLHVETAPAGVILGENSLMFAPMPRNIDAICVSDSCHFYAIPASDYHRLLETHPFLKEATREICLKREFKKALCRKMNRSFPSSSSTTSNTSFLREAFDVLDADKKGYFDLKDIRDMIRDWEPNYTENDMRDMIASLSSGGDQSGKVTWNGFRHSFCGGSVDMDSSSSSSNNNKKD